MKDSTRPYTLGMTDPVSSVPEKLSHWGSTPILVRHEIDAAQVLAAVASPVAGATVLFIGTTRSLSDGVVTQRLEYEAYEPMAAKTLGSLRDAAIVRFGLIDCHVVHRLGLVKVGETSVAIATSAAHRREAFEATQWLMEQINHEVPIWKCEQSADGSREWVHSGSVPMGFLPATPNESSPA